MILKARGLLLSLSLLFLTLLSLKAHAINSIAPQGITVSPAYQQVTIQPNESEHPISFKITNNEPSSKNIYLSSADFNTLNESGGLFFIGTNPTALQKKYGLAKWLSLPQDSITVAAKQTININAKILNLDSMPSGGHYGALMLMLNQSNTQSGNNISVHPIASSLLFVTKLGGDTHKLSLANVYITHDLFSVPSAITLRFQNVGNSHLIPRGVITIKNSRGQIISKGIINDNSGIILPETYRQYYVPLSSISSLQIPGKYNVNVDFRFDGTNQFRSYRVAYWYVPLWIVLLLISLILGLLFVIRRYGLKKLLSLPIRKMHKRDQ